MIGLITLLLFYTGSMYQSHAVITDLIEHLIVLEDSESMTLHYTFEGCYGVYQRGTIIFSRQVDTISYLSKSYDPDQQKSINQRGRYSIRQLIEILENEKLKKSEEILGNVINYQFESTRGFGVKRIDRIDQKHFIKLFHPFTSFLQTDKFKKKLSPSLRTPGIKH